MLHLLHIVIFAAILSVFFALLAGREGRRVRLGVILFSSLVGGALFLGLLMSRLA